MIRAAAVFLFSSSLLAQIAPSAKFEYWPGAQYDAAVPTLRKVAGYDIGERISPHATIVRYFETLAQAEPNRMKVFEYATTWEGRKLIYAVIGSEANIRRLAEVREGLAKLGDPRKTAASSVAEQVRTLPTVVWLEYGVHGNEISSSDAAIAAAYHLLAAKNNTVNSILANTLVVIDPLQNPDGRDRFIHSFEAGLGLEPDPNPLAAEHTEPWPGGRFNHYYFDMNRDWVAMTQPETKGRVAAMLSWHPQVVVDLHEMGTDSTYYFAPPATPFNPNMTKWQADYQFDIGKGNARYFDRFGFPYFTRDTYDAFYPGYGDSWPVYTGAIAMTFENGSTRGLVVRKSNEQTITYRETVRRHFVSSIATLETSSTHHDDLLTHYYEYGKTAVEEGTSGAIREYCLPRRGNTAQVDRLADLLLEQGVEVERATGGFTADGKPYPAGSYLVPLAQPAKRRVKNLLDLNTLMDDTFLKAEEERRKRRLPSQIYDVTAWSIPLQYNVDAVPLRAKAPVERTAVKLGETRTGRIAGERATVAYLVPWGSSGAARVMTGALREGLRLYGADKAFTQGSRSFGAGTVIVPVLENPEKVHAVMAKLAQETGTEIIAAGSSWVDSGADFGSRYTPYLKKPTIALAWDRPTLATSAGQTRFVLERQFGFPVTPVRTAQLSAGDLSQFQVIILPESTQQDGGYAGVLGPAGIARLKEWVADGGTLIGLGTATQFLADTRFGVLPVQQESKPGDAPKPAAPAADPAARPPGKLFERDADLDRAIQPDSELPAGLHGALARCRVDSEQWITAGIPEQVYAMVTGPAIYTPLKIDRGVNAVSFAGPGEVLAGGYMWDEFRKQLAYKPLLMVARSGRGLAIAFTADPNYRAALDGLNLLFINAVFRGPAHTTR